jgi:hypothetical protein
MKRLPILVWREKKLSSCPPLKFPSLLNTMRIPACKAEKIEIKKII